jgi:predicted transcriptional regulator
MSTVDNETPKQQMIALLQQQPEDSTFDELLRELAFAKVVERGLKDATTGRVVTNEEVKRRIESWGR